MSIFQVDMLTGLNKVETAIALLRACEPPEGYYGAFSGGKDSCVIKHLAGQASVKVDWHYCVSPIDPKEVQDFIKQYHPDVQWDYHARGFWKIVSEYKGLPTRKGRWCCAVIKEAGGLNRTLIVGNRAEEGTNRKKQKCFQKHPKVEKIFVSPILTWTSGEVWEYIGVNNIKVCSLYSEGLRRLGCVLCPFARDVEFEIKRFPKIARLWRLACDRIVERRLAKGKDDFKTGEELWLWWLDRDAKRHDKQQLSLEDTGVGQR